MNSQKEEPQEEKKSGFQIDQFEAQIIKLEKAGGLKKSKRKPILFTGSSSIVMWTSLKEDFPEYPVLNKGFGGSTLAEVNYYFDRIVAPYNPDTIVLYCGENDIAMGLKPDKIFEEFKIFVDKMDDMNPNAHLFYLSMKPSPSRWNLWPWFVEANAKIDTYCDSRDDLEYVSMNDYMLKSNRPDPSIFLEDGLHMNEEGYRRWKELLRYYFLTPK